MCFEIFNNLVLDSCSLISKYLKAARWFTSNAFLERKFGAIQGKVLSNF